MSEITAGKTVVITGASGGIGAAAALRLHADGHHVVIVGRSRGKTRAIADKLGADCYVADFARLEHVRSLAADLNDAYPRIDVLANNAGGIFGDRTKTVDGFEQTFQINHLAPFAHPAADGHVGQEPGEHYPDLERRRAHVRQAGHRRP